MSRVTIEVFARGGMAALAPVAPAIVAPNPNFGQMPEGGRGQNGPMAAGWQTGTEQVVGNTRAKGHHVQARADLVTQRNEAQVINQIEPERHQRIKLIDDGNTGGGYHRVELPLSQGTEIPRVDDELLNARAEARFSRYTEREMMDRAGGMVGGLADVWSSHLPHNSVLLDMVNAFDYGYVNGDNAADWFGGVAQELVGSVDTMIGKANLNPQQLGQLAKLENISALPPEFGLQGLRDQLTKAEFQQVKAQIELVNARLEQGVTDISQLVEKTAQRLPDGAGAIVAFSLINIAIAAAEYKRSGSARNATLLLFAGNLLLLSACGGVVTPEPGVTIVEPTQAAQSTEVQGGGDVVQPTVAPTEAAQPEAVASATPVIAAGATRTPEYQYPTNSWGLDNGEMFYDQEALGRIAAVPEAQQEFIQNEITPLLSSIDGIPAPSQDYTFFVNTTEDELLSWGIIFGTPQKYYIPKVRELNGNEGYDVSPWRASGDVTLLSYTEVVPPTHMGAVTQHVKALGVDNALIGLNANGEQVTWFDFASGEWKFTNQFLPDGADGYSFDNDRNTWVVVVGETTFEYRGGEWVEVVKEVVIPEWDFKEMGALPSVTSTNGEMTLNEDGSVTFKFIVGEKNSPVFGQEFSHTIPALSGEVIDITGAPAGPLSLVVEPLLDREPAIGSNYSPMVKMVNASGEVMAFYDYTSGSWKNTFENILTGLGEQELEEWMPQELGVIDLYKNVFEGYEGEFTFISLIGEPQRVFSQVLYRNGKNSKTITWLELKYNLSGDSMLIPVFDSDAPVMSGIVVVQESDGVDILATPRILDGNSAIDKDFERVLELLKDTPRVNVATAMQPDAYIESAYSEAEWRLELPVNYQGGPRHDLLRSSLEVDDENRQLQQLLVTQWLSDEEGNINGVMFGYTALGIFLN